MTVAPLTRKSLLYRSKVEYGGWTINHVQGCSHGCRYPCYAMMLARRIGRVSNYDEWVIPRVVENAVELLDHELSRLDGQIESVHLSFTTDPFMYDWAQGAPNANVCAMTLDIIDRLNVAGIPVTTLTKGVYPDELRGLASPHPLNSYGISLVSLSELFREEWEPGAAPAEARIAALEALAHRGHRTWASIEPYPTPNIDETAGEVEALLERISFVDSIVFGKWNYNAVATAYDREHVFYADTAARVRAWCEQRGKALHVKKSTPLANDAFAESPGCVPVAAT
jgi:DNA repair photolyase